MSSNLKGGDLPINRRFPSAGRWALLDRADRDRRGAGDPSAFDGSGDAAVQNPARPDCGSGGSYAYR
ncbi:hypothetical protein O7606_21780 [Micromonospora sp. WMMD882]|uniref:hypothetical protein n=1 Tax=Micromonospora sp. WMMD882 TaxID=3015151 RepID=UPI00248CA3D8|nr:hypothetical protein [Micromonospora sp. WMMD882]WBB78808.1 hypothetical protein O7606_21780 [Micromonospora sp. WMMD882]